MSALLTGTGVAGALLFAILSLGPGVAPAGSAVAPLQTVAQVDLARYAGTWVEVARLPNRFQKQCVADVTAEYRLRNDGRIDVTNRCREADGGYDQAQGVARVVDPQTRAKLEVSFVSLFGWQLFWGDYWIIDLEPDYRYVVVATPNRRYAWVLARPDAVAATLTSPLREKIEEVLRKAGYNPGEMRWVPGKHAENADAADPTR